MAVTVIVQSEYDEEVHGPLDWETVETPCWYLWYDQARADICRGAQNQADTTGQPQRIAKPIGYVEGDPARPIWGVWAWALPNPVRSAAIGLAK